MKSDILKISIVFFMLLATPIILPINAINIEKTNFPYEYYTYQKMTELLKNLQSQNPDIMKLESYGKTHEGRDIWFVKISDNVEIEEEDEPGVLLLGAHHGDEKIAFEILIFFIKYMMGNYTKENTDNDNDGKINEDPIDGKDNDQDGKIDEDPSEDRVRQAIDTTEIYMIPMINPDGVEANTRKNCNPDSIHGVNTNRNNGYDWKYYSLFPDLFGESWASKETSGNYRGPAPNSETETQAVIRVAESFTINISLSYHSGAEVVFYPWYHTTKTTPHEELFIEIGEEMGNISGYPLWIGSNPLIPKPGGTLGTSENYLYGEHKILAYTVESSNQKAPTNPISVYRYCYNNVGVHLYLCEKAQTVDNNKVCSSKSFVHAFSNIFSLDLQEDEDDSIDVKTIEETTSNGKIYGYTYRPMIWSWFPIPFARVRIGLQIKRTDKEGYYEFKNLPVDKTYTIVADAFGYSRNTEKVTLTTRKPEVRQNIGLYPIFDEDSVNVKTKQESNDESADLDNRGQERQYFSYDKKVLS